MARDDWRIRIELEEEEHAAGLLSRLGVDLGSRARELARELAGRRLAVSRDGPELFVYAASRAEAAQAREIVLSEIAEERMNATIGEVEHWLHDDERWDSEPPGPDVEEEMLRRGESPWEVRVECDSRGDAEELAHRLEDEGYGVVRQFRYVLVGAASAQEAQSLARKLHGEAEPSSELVWEVVPQNPFAVFGGMGGSGTPL